MAPRILAIGDIRVTNFTAPPQTSQQLPCCSFELGMARVSTTTVRCEQLTLHDILPRSQQRVVLTAAAVLVCLQFYVRWTQHRHSLRQTWLAVHSF